MAFKMIAPCIAGKMCKIASCRPGNEYAASAIEISTKFTLQINHEMLHCWVAGNSMEEEAPERSAKSKSRKGLNKGAT